VITGQSLALVFGVPGFTFLGDLLGWRGAMMVQAAATLLTAPAVWLAVPRARLRGDAGLHAPPSILPLLRPRVLGLLAAGTMERVCFAGMAVYLATYLLASYGVSLSGLAVGLSVTAVGNLAGNVLGGHLADRLPNRALTFATTSVLTGGLALPLMLWQPGLAGSIALGFAYSLANALGRPALIVALSEVSSEARGAILGLNITTGSLGWIGATGVGGWLIARFGFASLGVVTAAAALAGAVFAILSWWPGRPRAAPGADTP
jgi:predicted MFS family arabinose efflux permease